MGVIINTPTNGGSKNWTLLGDSTCSVGVDISSIASTCSEVLVVALRQKSTYTGRDVYEYIIANKPSTLAINTVNGEYYPDQLSFPNNLATGLHQVKITNNILTAVIQSSGADVSSTSYLAVYYR